MKTCLKCNEPRSLEDFWKNSGFADGRESTCKFCKNAQRREAYQENLDENREKARLQASEWYHANKDKAAAKRRRYEEKDPQKIKSMKRAWKEANPDRVLDHDQIRRARKRGTQIEPISRRAVWERDEGICHLCGDPVPFEEMHLEHIVPLAKGGTHTCGNVAPSHADCNLKKGAKAA